MSNIYGVQYDIYILSLITSITEGSNKTKLATFFTQQIKRHMQVHNFVSILSITI